MRIVLANPLYRYTPSEGGYPLNLVELGSFVRSEGFADTRVLDLNYETRAVFEPGAKLAAAVDALAALQPDVLGFSCATVHVPSVVELVRRVRSSFQTVVVLGGIHASSRAPQLFELCDIDFVVHGEGELTFTELLRVIEGGRDPGSVRGISFRRESGVHRTPDRPLLRSLGDLPLLDLEIFDFHGYFSWMDGADATSEERTRFLSGVGGQTDTPPDPRDLERSFSLVASRGCPHHCLFCSTSAMWRYQRRKPIERIAWEIDQFVTRFGRRGIAFEDDFLGCNRRWFGELLLLLEREGLAWSALTRIDSLDEDLIARMAQAGCRSIYHGIESGSAQVRSTLGKRYRGALGNDRIVSLVRAELEAGIQSTCSFMTGIPGETAAAMDETIELAAVLGGLGADGAQCFTQYWIMTAYPDTPATMRHRDRLVSFDRWRQLRQGDVFRFEQYLLLGDGLDAAREENPDGVVFLPDMELDEFLARYQAGWKRLGRARYTEDSTFVFDYFSEAGAAPGFTGLLEHTPLASLDGRSSATAAGVLRLPLEPGQALPIEGVRRLAPERVFLAPGAPLRDDAAAFEELVPALLGLARDLPETRFELERPVASTTRQGLEPCIRVPSSCADCLALFAEDATGRLVLCTGARYARVELMRSRSQILALLEQHLREQPQRRPACFDPGALAARAVAVRGALELAEVAESEPLSLNHPELVMARVEPVLLAGSTLMEPLREPAFDPAGRCRARFRNLVPLSDRGRQVGHPVEPGGRYALFQLRHEATALLSGAEIQTLLRADGCSRQARLAAAGEDREGIAATLLALVRKGILVQAGGARPPRSGP